VTDPTRPVREGEELDLAAVESFLESEIPGYEGPLEISQFPSGASNLTYLVKASDREMVLRRPPPGRKAKTAHDMSREVRVLTALAGVYPYVPKVLAFCDDPSVIGCDFYLMERLDGIILRKNLPRGLRLSREDTERLCHNVVDRLIDLHSIDYKAAGLGDLGKPEGYVRRQIDGWSRRYVDTIGDPLMDLGNSLAYWMQRGDPILLRIMRLQPTHLKGMMTRDEVVDYYCRKTGIEIETFDFYRIYGLFRLVVIMQQIYYRYYHRQTRNKRFGRFIYLIKYLEGYLNRLIDGSLL